MSALADGQLRDDETPLAWKAIERNDEAAASWNRYHLIGEALRSPIDSSLGLAANADSTSFLDRLNLKLQGEDFHVRGIGELALPLLVAADLHTSQPSLPTVELSEAANDNIFRWKLLAGFATLAAVSVITWTAVGPTGPSIGASQLATAEVETQILVATPQGSIVRDARLNELLAAHKQLGSTSALQAPTGFLQSAAFETTIGSGR